MEHNNNYSGRLYLAKGKENIYVEVKHILQHQIEGIRFLYRQFKKNKSGVILNDFTSSGKTHQVVLFIKAIKPLLKEPVLILCSAHEKNHWLSHFLELTDFGNGVLVEPTNLNTKRMSICIDTKGNLASLVSHDWSIVVVDDDSTINNILKKVFKTKYKIWITSVEMKTNLEAFCSIFGWLCPKEKEDVLKIISQNKDKKDNIYKLILLDAVMEDFVLRRTSGISQFKKQNNLAKKETNIIIKNKDVTGTKTKRSIIRSSTEKSSVSNELLPSTLKSNDNIAENNDDNYVYTEKNEKDQSREEHDEDNIIQQTEPMDNYEPKELTVLESMSINNASKNNQRSEAETSNDIDVVMKNGETPEIPTEPNTSIGDDAKVVDNLNVSTHCQEMYHEKTTLHTTGANDEQLDDKNIKNKNESSRHKNIDEVMKEMEEKALQKFKGSLLDSIF